MHVEGRNKWMQNGSSEWVERWKLQIIVNKYKRNTLTQILTSVRILLQSEM